MGKLPNNCAGCGDIFVMNFRADQVLTDNAYMYLLIKILWRLKRKVEPI